MTEQTPDRPNLYERIWQAWHGTDEPWGGCADSAAVDRVAAVIRAAQADETTPRSAAVWRALEAHARVGAVDLGGWRCRCGAMGADGYHGHARHQADEVAALRAAQPGREQVARVLHYNPDPDKPLDPANCSMCAESLDLADRVLALFRQDQP